MSDGKALDIKPGGCFWCGKQCGGTCLGVAGSTQMKTSDPAYFLLTSGHTSSSSADPDENCYICRDPEFAQMGLPLCRHCDACRLAGRGNGHVPADDEECTACGNNARWDWELEEACRANNQAAIYEASGGQYGSPL